MASSGLRKILYLAIFDTLNVWVLVCPAIFIDIVVKSNHVAMAVVIAIGLCWQMLYLEIVADVIATLYCYIYAVDDG